MELQTHWQTTPNFEKLHQREWLKLKSYLEELSPADECIIGDFDWGRWIRLLFKDNKKNIGFLEYDVDDIAELTIDQFIADVKSMPRILSTKEQTLLQKVFNEFKNKNEWPYSREMSVKTLDLGDYFEMVKAIGAEYIIAYDENKPESISRLTIQGVHLCEGSEAYLSIFMHVLGLLVMRYVEKPLEPIVTVKEFIEEGIIQSDEESMLYWMLVQERELWSEASSDAGYKNSKFTVSPKIIKYKDVNNVRKYLILKKVSSVKPEATTLPIDAVVLGSEGVKVIKQVSEKAHKYDLFISYSHIDEARALELKQLAEERGLSAFLSEKDIESGDVGEEEIKQALINSKEVAFLMTPKSVKSEWVIKEWGATWVLGKRATPILYRCDISNLPVTLQSRQARDFSDLNRYFEEVLKRRQHAP